MRREIIKALCAYIGMYAESVGTSAALLIVILEALLLQQSMQNTLRHP